MISVKYFSISLIIIIGYRILTTRNSKSMVLVTHSLYQQIHCIFDGFQGFCIKVVVRLVRAALHVSFDTKLACSFLYVGVRDYAEMNLFTVNTAHFCIIHFLSCKSVLSIRFASKHYYPVFSPISCRSRFRYGVLPVSVDKC